MSTTKETEMKIVHEIEGEAQSAVGGHLYATKAQSGRADGFRCDVILTVEDDGKGVMEETILIEGDGWRILQALREVVDQLEGIAESYIERGMLDCDWLKNGGHL
jgi:two-component sensor histidine kinase